MLDMGFLPDIRRVLQHLPVKRQTLFFSATMPQPIVQLSREMLKNPAMISIERKAEPAAGIAQSVFPVSQDLKLSLLEALLARGEIRSAIVFTRTKHRANRVYEQLEKRKVSVARIHGNRSQIQRTEALAGFKSGRYRILVATDIAARGIDVEALSHVVNFDVPHVPEDYIHRVGRTARAEMTGDAITFVAPDEENDLRAIERAIGKRLPRVTVPDFDYSRRRPKNSRFRSTSGSPPSAPEKRTIARGRRPKRSGARWLYRERRPVQHHVRPVPRQQAVARAEGAGVPRLRGERTSRPLMRGVSRAARVAERTRRPLPSFRRRVCV
jgi:ATP-dependent RNA helicase RhlE